MPNPVKYLVMSATKMQLYTCSEPPDAVRAFMHEYPDTREVTVFVADYIGKFTLETVIQRLPEPPRITKPDGPNAMRTVAGPNNIKPVPQ